MDSVKMFHVGAVLKHPTFSPLSLWERAKVRGFLSLLSNVRKTLQKQ
jgi:hypothetical protein